LSKEIGVKGITPPARDNCEDGPEILIHIVDIKEIVQG
jgi:hypothetical protein